MNKFPKILLVYFAPYFAFLLYCVFASPDELNRLLPRVFGGAYAIYMLVGIVVIPILLYGIPSVASIRTEILSDRVRRGAKRKVQIAIASLLVTLISGLIMVVSPPHSTLSAVFDIFLFLLLIGSFLWLRSRIKSD